MSMISEEIIEQLVAQVNLLQNYAEHLLMEQYKYSIFNEVFIQYFIENDLMSKKEITDKVNKLSKKHQAEIAQLLENDIKNNGSGQMDEQLIRTDSRGRVVETKEANSIKNKPILGWPRNIPKA